MTETEQTTTTQLDLFDTTSPPPEEVPAEETPPAEEHIEGRQCHLCGRMRVTNPITSICLPCWETDLPENWETTLRRRAHEWGQEVLAPFRAECAQLRPDGYHVKKFKPHIPTYHQRWSTKAWNRTPEKHPNATTAEDHQAASAKTPTENPSTSLAHTANSPTGNSPQNGATSTTHQPSPNSTEPSGFWNNGSPIDSRPAELPCWVCGRPTNRFKDEGVNRQARHWWCWPPHETPPNLDRPVQTNAMEKAAKREGKHGGPFPEPDPLGRYRCRRCAHFTKSRNQLSQPMCSACDPKQTSILDEDWVFIPEGHQ